MKIIFINIISIDSPWNLSRGLNKAETLKELLEKSDFITIHILLLLEQTRYCILGMDEVLCVPHLEVSTAKSEENCAIISIKELKDYLENNNIKNSVNYPEYIMLRRISSYRISIVNHNIPNMVG